MLARGREGTFSLFFLVGFSPLALFWCGEWVPLPLPREEAKTWNLQAGGGICSKILGMPFHFKSTKFLGSALIRIFRETSFKVGAPATSRSFDLDGSGIVMAAPTLSTMMTRRQAVGVHGGPDLGQQGGGAAELELEPCAEHVRTRFPPSPGRCSLDVGVWLHELAADI